MNIALSIPRGDPIIKADPVFDMVLRFNLFPAEYADASWISAVDEKLDRIGLGRSDHSSNVTLDFLAVPMQVRQMSLALLRRRELERQYDFDFSDTGKRLALLAQPALQSLGQRTAAFLARPLFQRLIRGDDVAATDAVVGRDLRLHALSQRTDIENLAAGLDSIRDAVGSAIGDPQAWAQMPLRIAISVLPENAVGVRARLRYKFPREWRHIPRFNLDDTQRRLLVRMCLFAGVESDGLVPEFIWKKGSTKQGEAE